MRTKPVCKKRTVVATSRLFTIEEMHLEFSNGAKRVFERIKGNRHGAVLVVAVTEDKALILVREYAAGIDAYELAFPKGVIDEGESSLDAANRELQEETGFAAKELNRIKTVTLAPGYFAATLDIVVAQNLYPSFLEGDEPEPPEVVKWPLNDLDALLERSDFSEARSIAALFLVKEWLNKRKYHDK